jgi:threonylcarbamoyladenosine tRNA methylthiotransferase MtaB
MKKVFISTLGCKVNQYESAAFKTRFEEAGHTIVASGENADIVVINTCAVTANAGAQSRQAVRHSVRANPEARIIITGCFTEIGEKELSSEKELLGREYSIVGNSKKDRLVANALENEAEFKQILLGSIEDAKEICRLPVRKFGDRSRAYLRIQDGCESYCTYCIVPYTRGASRSLPRSEVIEQAMAFTAEGHREIVLTGIHLGLYGSDLCGNENLESLLDTVSKATPQTSYRISSLEPTEITDTLLELIRDSNNIQPHLHIPLQSGDDHILSRMNRKYTTSEFRSIVNKCRHNLPDCALGIDVLAGFPGETANHFANTLNFLESLDFTYLHVFPYSIRPGTAAATFSDQISKSMKNSRVATLRELSNRKKGIFYTSQIGKTYPAFIEGKRCEDGYLKGFTSNYVAVRFDGPDSLLNDTTRVKLLSPAEGYIWSQREESNES